jgi:ABC-2 type transport system permease protein
LSPFLPAFRFQLSLVRRSPEAVQTWVTTPLLALAFAAVTEVAHRPDLAVYGVVAPTLMALWTTVLFAAGDMITSERDLGTLELLLSTPARLSVLVLGRLCAVASLNLAAFAESWLVTGVVAGWVAVPHPAALAATLLVTGLAMAGTASVLSGLFVLMPSARTIQNTLSYPFYLLGGVLVPVSYLPGWLHPAGRLVFLSWSSDLLRAVMAPGPVQALGTRLAVIAGLGAAGYGAGTVLLARVLRRVRALGTLSHT